MPTCSIARASRGCATAARCCTPGPSAPHATREPLQFGAEIYGHAGLEADLEVLTAGAGLPARPRSVPDLSVDLADARIVRALLAGVPRRAPTRWPQVHAALAAKDATELAAADPRLCPPPVRQGLLALVQLYGDESVLDEAEKALPPLPGVRRGADRT